MRRLFVGHLAAGIVVLGLVASACGSSSPGVANVGAGSATTLVSGSSSSNGGSKQSHALAFARCMRSHGVTNFPDPSSSGAISISAGSSSGLDPSSPQFQAAQKTCQSLLPRPSAAQQHQAEQNALKFAECMRSHGVTNFPDPQFNTSGGGFGIRIHGGAGSGLDPSSPQFQAAQKACGKYMHLPNGGPGHKQTTGGSGSAGSGVVIGG
jgi:hypothetical protein